MLNLDDVTRFEEAKQFLREMIRIPSVTGEEGELACYLEKRLLEFGVDEVYKQEVEKNRYNVIARVNGPPQGRTILLTGHIDTVPPGDGWQHDPFGAEETDGRIYGRGANDMKAGTAIILETVKTAVAYKDELPVSLLVALVCDEEAYSSGITKFLEEVPVQADFGLAAEPEYAEALVGAMGKILVQVTVTGQATHAATPQLGINAVEEGAKFIAGLGQIALRSHSRMGSQPYVPLTARAEMETYSMVVPASFQFLINKHTVPGETKDKVLGDQSGLVKKLGLRAKFDFAILPPFYPPYELDLPNQDLEHIKELYLEVTGRPLGEMYGTGVCDNNLTVPKTHIPVINLGPNGGGMHASDEWVDLAQMRNILSVYLRYIFGR